MRKKILVVDDSATARLQVVEALADLDFEVIQAEHGDDGLTKLEQHPDTALVISDVNMPWKDGMEMLAEIRASDYLKTIPVVMLTTEGNPDEFNKAKALGIKGWMVKPFKPETLRQAVMRLLASSES